MNTDQDELRSNKINRGAQSQPVNIPNHNLPNSQCIYLSNKTGKTKLSKIFYETLHNRNQKNLL